MHRKTKDKGAGKNTKKKIPSVVGGSIGGVTGGIVQDHIGSDLPMTAAVTKDKDGSKYTKCRPQSTSFNTTNNSTPMVPVC